MCRYLLISGATFYEKRDKIYDEYGEVRRNSEIDVKKLPSVSTNTATTGTFLLTN